MASDESQSVVSGGGSGGLHGRSLSQAIMDRFHSVIDRELPRIYAAAEASPPSTAFARLREAALAAPPLYESAVDLAARRSQMGFGNGVHAVLSGPAYREWVQDAAPLDAPRPTPKDPARIALLPAVGEQPDAEYVALAQELGVHAAALVRQQFVAWLDRSGLRVYDWSEVQEYLHHAYDVPAGNLTAMVRWGWRPLRHADRRATALGAYNGLVQYGATPYAKPIPYPVLLTVKSLLEVLPATRFYVSDDLDGEQIPDPFLLVEIGADHRYVIERWDEPAFRPRR